MVLQKQSNMDHSCLQTIRTTRGNTICADCGTPSKSTQYWQLRFCPLLLACSLENPCRTVDFFHMHDFSVLCMETFYVTVGGGGGGGGGLLNILQVTHLTFCLPKFPQNVMFWSVLDFLLRTPPPHSYLVSVKRSTSDLFSNNTCICNDSLQQF